MHCVEFSSLSLVSRRGTERGRVLVRSPLVTRAAFSVHPFNSAQVPINAAVHGFPSPPPPPPQSYSVLLLHPWGFCFLKRPHVVFFLCLPRSPFGFLR